MAQRTRTGKSGFTMIELLIVMAVITILVSMAVPFYQKSIIRSKESVLRNNLFTLRTVIDEYTMDKGKAPQTLQDLVSEGYLRERPDGPDDGLRSVLEGHHGRRNDQCRIRRSLASSMSAAVPRKPVSKAQPTPSGDPLLWSLDRN